MRLWRVKAEQKEPAEALAPRGRVAGPRTIAPRDIRAAVPPRGHASRLAELVRFLYRVNGERGGGDARAIDLSRALRARDN